MWNTWGPIQATARVVYDWDDYVIDLMAAWGCITFCIAMVPFAWIMDVKGTFLYYRYPGFIRLKLIKRWLLTNVLKILSQRIL